jgi:acyl carrier protein
MDSVLDDVRAILARLLAVDPDLIRPSTNVRELPNVDSLAILETVLAIEDHFQIEIPDALVLKLDRVVDIAEAVRHLQPPQAHAS